jgi:hypothetical protein
MKAAMNAFKLVATALALTLVVALPAEAQLQLQISNGRVTMDAVNVPARQILAEWARIGGTKIVGSEKMTGAPLTLKLVDMPERQALDIILRNVAGFMAAPRQASSAPGASAYDRILIMATSSAPSQAANPRAPGPNAGNQANGFERRVPPRPPNLPPSVGDEPAEADDQEMVEDDQADSGVAQQPVFTFPAPNNGAPGTSQPVFVPTPNANGQSPGMVTAPVITLQPGTNGPTIYNFVPNENGAGTTTTSPSTPTRGFGVIGAPTPGMIQAPPPDQQQPVQTTPRPPRPPGGV